MSNYLRGVLLLLAFALSVVSKADDRVLQIWQADGNVINIKLDESPKTKYVEGDLVITTAKSSIAYPLEKVRKYTYATIADGIAVPAVMVASFSNDGETLSFSGLKSGTTASLYNMSGQLLQKQTTGASGKLDISVSNQPAGIYLVKVNDVTYKITKR